MPLILLDRDGVINKNLSPNGTINLNEFQFIDGATKAIKILKKTGYKIAIVTNQSAIGKGLMSEETLQNIHKYMLGEIKANGGDIDRIYFCPDHPNKPTNRRKPNAGMLQEALKYFNENPAKTFMIGDNLSDIQAGIKAGCPTIYLTNSKKINKNISAHNPIIFPDLLNAVKHITN